MRPAFPCDSISLARAPQYPATLVVARFLAPSGSVVLMHGSFLAPVGSERATVGWETVG